MGTRPVLQQFLSETLAQYELSPKGPGANPDYGFQKLHRQLATCEESHLDLFGPGIRQLRADDRGGITVKGNASGRAHRDWLRIGVVYQLIFARFNMDLRQNFSKPIWNPPVRLANDGHDCRDKYQPDNERINENGGTQCHPE